jgi:cold shock CspA family protein
MTNKKYVGIIVGDKTTFGFIECPELEGNIFYHCSNCVPQEQLMKGDKVSFQLGVGKNGRQQALDVHLFKEEDNVGTNNIS